MVLYFFQQKTSYELRMSDWISDVALPIYFTDKGRDCLTGFMHYLVSHVNDAKSDKGIPTQWRGMEASVPMLVDWIADAQFQAGKAAEEKNAQAAANKQLPTADGMKIFLSGLADQIRAGGYSERAFTS